MLTLADRETLARTVLAAADRTRAAMKIWAVIPVKELGAAKQRLAGALDPALRRELALAMLEDVLDCVAAVPQLAGIIVATVDPERRRARRAPWRRRLARGCGARP